MEDNPYQAPRQQSHDRFTTVVQCLGNTIAVRGEMVPSYFPLVGKIELSINGSDPISSAALHWQEQIDFPLEVEGSKVVATLKTVGIDIGAGQKFAISIDDQRVVESSVKMKRWLISFILGMVIGAVLGSTILVAAVFLLRIT